MKIAHTINPAVPLSQLCVTPPIDTTQVASVDQNSTYHGTGIESCLPTSPGAVDLSLSIGGSGSVDCLSEMNRRDVSFFFAFVHNSKV
mmetsp:Transcript_9629/g.16793  ORF Transcript_9629/g.16793 Transcript_9629/m.16793 type:complete len:88 (-) Transcript_9629:26-289(-)